LKYYRDSQFEAEIKGIGMDEIERIIKESTKIEN
jgi:hypothetical protein